jgi:ribose 5-phosphate isomerase RpiB
VVYRVRIAVINETSAGDKNKDIMNALEGFGHEVINAGMKKSGGDPELTYIETALLGAILLNIGRVDLVVGGCGTGQGFLNAVMQYPNVFCGLISEPLDAWLFRQINGGNCISLALNKGYGWAGDVNLKFIFEKMFSVGYGVGYPEHRKESQRKSREILCEMSKRFHLSFELILEKTDDEILEKVLRFPGVTEIINIPGIDNKPVKSVLEKKCEVLRIPY